MKTESNSNEVELIVNRHYNKKELCVLFGNITMYYLNRMIDNTPDLGDPLGTSYSPRQVSVLVNHYGFGGTFLKNQSKLK